MLFSQLGRTKQIITLCTVKTISPIKRAASRRVAPSKQMTKNLEICVLGAFFFLSPGTQLSFSLINRALFKDTATGFLVVFLATRGHPLEISA